MERAEKSSERRPPGRPAGDSDARERILRAALEAFAARGFRGATMRGVAAQAGVDPALIRHYFGDKAALFAAAVAEGSGLVPRMAAAMEQGGPDRGRRVADAYLRLWEEPANLAVIRAMLGTALTAPEALGSLRDVLLARVASRAPGGSEGPGVALVASQLVGLAFARHIIQLPGVAELSREELVELVAPTIERYLAMGDGETIPGA